MRKISFVPFVLLFFVVGAGLASAQQSGTVSQVQTGGANAQVAQCPPTISSLTPAIASVGTTVTITGTCFLDTGNTISFTVPSGGIGSRVFYNVSSLDGGTTLTFVVPATVYTRYELTGSGTANVVVGNSYNITVSSAAGKTSPVGFVVAAGQTVSSASQTDITDSQTTSASAAVLPPALSFTKTLAPSQKADPQVMALQGFLANQGLLKLSGAPTGIYGTATANAVKQLQKQLQVAPTGVVGPLTGKKIQDLIAYKTSIQDVPAVSGLVTQQSTVAPSATAPVLPVTTLPAAVQNIQIALPTPNSPRIMYWWGKVNQHIDTATGAWMTDPDGVSGANLDKLTYCQKFYPNTVSVTPYQYESIDTWHDRGNVNNYSSTVMSDLCVQGVGSVNNSENSTTVNDTISSPVSTVNNQQNSATSTQSTATPANRLIMYWWGKVNQHTDATGTWVTDPDGVSGANIDELTYCQKFWPDTASVTPYMNVTNNVWQDRGNVQNPNNLAAYYATEMSYSCVPANTTVVNNSGSNNSNSDVSTNTGSTIATTTQTNSAVVPRIMYWWGKVNEHVDIKTGAWMTDPDGVSGANLDKLTYCQKFYPNTVSVTPYMNETNNVWQDAGNVQNPNNLAAYYATEMSYRCVQSGEATTTTTTSVNANSQTSTQSAAVSASPASSQSLLPPVLANLQVGASRTSAQPTQSGPANTQLTLTYPNGGQILTQGQVVAIAYTGGNTSWPIYLSLVNSSLTQVYATIVNNAQYSGGFYSWTIPSTIAPGQYYIYVEGDRGDASGFPSPYGSSWDYSDGSVTIIASNQACGLKNQYQLTVLPDSGTPASGTVSVGSTSVDLLHFKVQNNTKCDIVVNGFNPSIGYTPATGSSDQAQYWFDALKTQKFFDANGTLLASGSATNNLSVPYTIPAGTMKAFVAKMDIPSPQFGSGVILSGEPFRLSLGNLQATNIILAELLNGVSTNTVNGFPSNGNFMTAQ